MCKFASPPKDKIKEHISPSLAFPSPNICLINDGAGKLYLCITGKRSGQLEKQNWHSDDIALVKDFEEPYYLHQCCQHENDNLFCMLLSLEDEKKSDSSHPRVFVHLLEFVQNCKGSSSAGDRFIVKCLETLTGASVPLYTSYSPDFNSVIIASRKKFLFDAEDKPETGKQSRLFFS